MMFIMMKALRKNYKKIMIGLAILVIPPFVWWGTGPSSQKEKIPKYAGVIGSHKIAFQEYRAVYTHLYQSLRDLFDSAPAEDIITELTWTRLLLLQEAKNRGLKITDQEVRNRIEQFPHFQKEGKFDSADYQKALGERARFFEENLRQELLLDKLQEHVTSSIQLTEDEIRNEFMKENEKIELAYALIPIPQEQNSDNDVSKDSVSKDRETLRQKANDYHQQLDQKIKSGISAEEAFKQSGLEEIIHTEPLSRNATIPNLGYQPALLDAAFGTPEGNLGPLIEINNDFCLFWVVKNSVPSDETFQAEKANYSIRLLERRKQRSFNEWLADLRQKTPIKSNLSDLKD